MQAQHGMVHAAEHALDLILTALSNLDLDKTRMRGNVAVGHRSGEPPRNDATASGLARPIVQLYATAQRLQVLIAHIAVDQRDIGLPDVL